ncbi:MAG: calcium-translocating P-type ATPase, PMCA-type [Clostridia bacterium]|nr:calcium-translocating P-type ATPase, PMCA-type [Clostridia bacterium]
MTEAKAKKTSKAYGLTETQVEESRREHGANVLGVRKSKSFIRRFFENLGDPVIRILLVALGINLIFVFKGADITETIGIGISVFLAAFISALSESGGENAFRRLSGECAKQSCRVRRDGKIKEVPIEDIVVGDIVIISAGEKICADGYLLSGALSVDQSAITGESKEARKEPTGKKIPSPSEKATLLRGCPVLSGEGEFEVFAVGDQSFLGKISIEVQTDTRESPLKLRLSKLAKQISRLGYLAAFLIAFAYLFNCIVVDSSFEWILILMKVTDVAYILEKLLHAFMLGLTVIVVAVPEGLPMMIAVVLSSNIRRMVRDNVLVRKPVGIEAAGSMNLLLTDKTGTLTEGKMSVECVILGEGEKTSCAALVKRHAPIAKAYVDCCRYNTQSSLSDGKAVGGNGTERALLDSASAFFASDKRQVVSRIPFDSSVKYSTATVRDGKRMQTLIKGAPERLLPFVNCFMRSDGSIGDFSPYRNAFERKIADACAEGKRILIVAVSDGAPDGRRLPTMTLVCAAVLADPLRKEARRSVKELRDAGIGVIMITGDSKATAASIAKDCGIIGGSRNMVLESRELAQMSDAQISDALPNIAVVARALPTDKSRLVRIAQAKELVVGMTGDGINDAPALKTADIGFAMGSGTDVAKDAGDIIILDNDLASIVKAVLYGRNIFKSIRKFITLQLTMNFCAVGVSMIGPFIGFDAPVTVVQMLWINIIMDTLGGLAFAGEAPSPLCMKEKPKRRDEPILNRYMINQIVILGGFTVGLCIFFLLSPDVSAHFRYAHDKIYLLTAFFALFIFTSVFNCFNCRSDRLKMLSGITKNPAFIGIMTLIAAVQIVFVYLGGSVLRTLPLTASELIFTLLLSLCVFPVEFLRRLIWRLRGKKNGF